MRSLSLDKYYTERSQRCTPDDQNSGTRWAIPGVANAAAVRICPTAIDLTAIDHFAQPDVGEVGKLALVLLQRPGNVADYDAHHITLLSLFFIGRGPSTKPGVQRYWPRAPAVGNSLPREDTM